MRKRDKGVSGAFSRHRDTRHQLKHPLWAIPFARISPIKPSPNAGGGAQTHSFHCKPLAVMPVQAAQVSVVASIEGVYPDPTALKQVEYLLRLTHSGAQI